MAAPSQINTLRAEDFPKGLQDKGQVDKLFQILNPFLQNVQTTTTAGTALLTNLDGQFVQADLPKGSGWQTMSLTSPFETFATGASWPQPAYRIDGTGRLHLRGLFKAASAPTPGQTFWTFPKALFSPTDSGSNYGRLFGVPVVDDGGGAALVRFDVWTNTLAFGSGTSGVFGAAFGDAAWNNLTLATYNNLTTIQYRRDGDGIVKLRGAFSSNAGATGGTMATLPVGYRPAVTARFPIVVQTTAPAFPAGTLTINTDGTMVTEFAGGITIAKCGLDHVSFSTGTLSTGRVIVYGSLDGVSWDTQGGPSLSTRPGFPLNIRIKDGKKPVTVICWALNKDTNAVEICTEPAWTALGTGPSGNLLTINNVANLRDDQPYTLNFFIFF